MINMFNAWNINKQQKYDDDDDSKCFDYNDDDNHD